MLKSNKFSECSSSSNDKVEKIVKVILDLIPSPSPSVNIKIMGGKVCLRCKGKTLLGVIISLLASPNNGLPYYLK